MKSIIKNIGIGDCFSFNDDQSKTVEVVDFNTVKIKNGKEIEIVVYEDENKSLQCMKIVTLMMSCTVK